MKLLYLIFAIIPLAVATAAAQEKPPVTACKCARVECPPEQPNKCKCENEAAKRCAALCGTKPPAPKICKPQSCGSRGLPNCPVGQTCVNDPKKPGCDIAVDCPGICVTQRCGSLGLEPCPKGFSCVDDPNSPCGTASDCPGFCARLNGSFCGGIAGLSCPSAVQTCVDDPRDDCNPFLGGSDCAGTCVYI